MVIAIFKASKFDDNIFIYCRFNIQKYKTVTLYKNAE
jgi:hypothetical protein